MCVQCFVRVIKIWPSIISSTEKLHNADPQLFTGRGGQLTVRQRRILRNCLAAVQLLNPFWHEVRSKARTGWVLGGLPPR